ncbi:RagB/SusD family nutrient uptake outer membrane protein [Chitinophaga rhizophila]|nr:RagB/SusD family nutrient uptake outer membrane protein [Chitinophaga rhizophila]
MKKLNIATVVLGTMFLATGCSKYTDIKTQGTLIPGQVINYRYLLNNTGSFESGGYLPDIAAADVEIVDSLQQQGINNSVNSLYFRNCYTWQSPIYENTLDRDRDWDTYYGTIYNCNVIIEEVPGAAGGTPEDKAELIAEALTHRSDAYLNLVNEYAKPYNAATAGTDLGVPLLIRPTLEQPLIRASVSEIYARIEADLKTAVISLPRNTQYNTLPGKAAAWSVLARMYLLMGNYASAALYADSALSLKSTILDLTAGNIPFRRDNPETIFGKISASSFSWSPTTLRLSQELLDLLGTADLRYQLFTADAEQTSGAGYTGRIYSYERINFENRSIGTSVPEMMLIKAEGLARAGSPGPAMDLVNTLRQKRFQPADYTPLTATDANDAIIKVVQERRREFFCRMLPWFDQRRLKDDPLFRRTYTRTWLGTTYTLEPSSNRYVFPIGQYYLRLNPELQQNP